VTPAAARPVIEAAIETGWAGATTVAYPNRPFTPPATGNWLKVDFVWGNASVLTKGVTFGLNSVVGILQLAVFGPKDKGDGALMTLAETARALVNRKRFASPNADIMFGAVSGPRTLYEESWRSLVISAPFQVVETVS
jgi:hypothetical protein